MLKTIASPARPAYRPASSRPARLRRLADIARCAAGLAVAAVVGLAAAPAWAQQHTVDSPRVRQMVDAGVKYLQDQVGRGGGDAYDVLGAYAVYKATEDPEHPVVKDGVGKALKILENIDDVSIKSRAEFNYYVSIAAQLLASVDPIKYSPQLQIVLDRYKERQKANGSFGYSQVPYEQLGDISQTQYVLLALWSLEHANMDIPPEMVERTLAFLNQSQIRGGGWPYQFPSTAQEYPPTHVMTAVGMSAVMIGADLLGVLRGGGGSALAAGQAEVDAGVPTAFRRVLDEADGKQTKVSQQAVADLVRRGRSWLDANAYRRVPGETWHYYWLYSIERYQAFWDAMNNQTQPSPKWYNDGVEELIRLQAPNGGWGVLDRDFGSPQSCTAFAILFLLRTTQKAIGDLNEAVFSGNQGLPADLSQVDLTAGKIEDKKPINDIDEALASLSDTTDNQTAAKLASRIRLPEDPAERDRQLESYARLIRSGDAASRIIAAKLLSRGDNLDMVPHLIYALSDIEPAVARYAENSLRVLSRQLGTYKIPSKGDVTPEDRLAAQEYWKTWYKTIRPDYVFLQND